MRCRNLFRSVQALFLRSRAIAGRAALGCVLLVPIGITAPGGLLASGGQEDTEIRGKLPAQAGKTPVLHHEGKDVSLVSDKRSVAETLKDPRLSGRELKVVGHFKGDGSFEVREFFVVRPDALYRVIYHCDVCNITTFSPGDCMCCQAPTVPVEVLPTDPRIYHEEIQGPPKSEPPE
jgi:hypothetical protein